MSELDIEAVNAYNPRHPHEPEVEPVFDPEGRCLVCGFAVQERQECEQALRAALENANQAANEVGNLRMALNDEMYKRDAENKDRERLRTELDHAWELLEAGLGYEALTSLRKARAALEGK